MQIKNVEHSPIPYLKSIKTTRLIFSIKEWNTLVKAKKILDQAETMLTKHYQTIEPDMYGDNTTTTLSDYNPDLSLLLPYNTIEELLEQSTQGLKID